MNYITLKNTLWLIGWGVLFLPGFGYARTPGDTIVISFSGNSKVLILVDSKEDLKGLQKYDLNKMLETISLSVDTLDPDEHYLRLEDENGTHYLRDTTLTLQGEEDPGDEDRYEAWSAEEESEKEDEREEDEYESFSYRHWNKDHGKRTNNFFSFEFGMNNYLENGRFPDDNNELYSVKPWGSWFVGLNGMNRTRVSGPLHLDWGGGISWYNFKFQNTSTVLEETTEGAIFYDDTLLVDPVKSKLTSVYLNVSLVPIFCFGENGHGRDWVFGSHGDGLRVGLGGYAGYRIDSHTKNVWEVDGDKKKDKDYNNFYLQNLRYGLQFRFGYEEFDIFVNYDLNELFVEGKGPALNAFSFGIIF